MILILPYIFAGVSCFTFGLQSNRKSTNENSTWCSMHSAVCISVCMDMFGEWHVLAFTSGFFFQFCLLEQQKEHNREHHLVVNALEAMCLDKLASDPSLHLPRVVSLLTSSACLPLPPRLTLTRLARQIYSVLKFVPALATMHILLFRLIRFHPYQVMKRF